MDSLARIFIHPNEIFRRRAGLRVESDILKRECVLDLVSHNITSLRVDYSIKGRA